MALGVRMVPTLVLMCCGAGREGLGMAEMVEAFGRSVNKPVTAGIIRQLPGGPPAVLTMQLTPREAGA